MPRVLFDITYHEPVFDPPSPRIPFHPYPDLLPHGLSVLTYSLNELLAEQVRALYERTRPCDLYDVVYLLENQPGAFDFLRVCELFGMKCTAKQFEAPLAADLLRVTETTEELRTEWEHMRAPGARPVTAALPGMGLARDRHVTNDPRVLHRARWSARQGRQRRWGIRLTLLVPPAAAIVRGADETIERRSGRKSTAKGCDRDAVRAPKPPVLRCVGLKWGSLRLLVSVLQATPAQRLAWVVMRWSVEVTFAEVRAPLGRDTQRQWSDQAMARTTPVRLALCALVTVRAWPVSPGGQLPRPVTAWYRQAEPTFADCLDHTEPSPSFPTTAWLGTGRSLAAT